MRPKWPDRGSRVRQPTAHLASKAVTGPGFVRYPREIIVSTVERIYSFTVLH